VTGARRSNPESPAFAPKDSARFGEASSAFAPKDSARFGEASSAFAPKDSGRFGEASPNVQTTLVWELGVGSWNLY
jgi:hypothetical protein